MEFYGRDEQTPNAATQQLLNAALQRPDNYLYEFEAYQLFAQFGIKTPDYRYFPLADLAQLQPFLQADKKYVLKCHIPGVLHKTEIGGVELFVTAANCAERLSAFVERLPKTLEGVIAVEMADFYTKTPSAGEILLSALLDSAFGPVVCYGLGGTTVEQLKTYMPDSVLFIPAAVDIRKSPCWLQKLEAAPATQFLTGKIRSIPKQCDLSEIIDAVTGMQRILN